MTGEDTGGTVWDAPNKQVLGLDPPWVEGSGGSGAGAPEPKAAAASSGEPDLDEMTKDELLAYAQNIGVSPANASLNKDELRAGIDAKLAERGGDG